MLLKKTKEKSQKVDTDRVSNGEVI